MKRVVCMLALLGMMVGLCVGCGKKEEPEPQAAAPEESSAKAWEPETATQPAVHNEHDGHDHSGHSH